MQYSLAFILPLMTVLGFYIGGDYTWLGFVYIGFIHPILDFTYMKDKVVNDKMPDFLLRMVLPIQIVVILLCLHLYDEKHYSYIGAIFSLSITLSCFGIVAAHELIHRPSKLDYYSGVLLLSLTGYAHFAIEHVYGHHKNVGTEKDPATAKKNQTVYAFYFQAIIGGFINSWKIAKSRKIVKKLIKLLVIQSIILVAICLLFPDKIDLLFWSIFGGMLNIETIQYIEHYGLTRDPSEKVEEFHTWDSYHSMTNLSLFNLGYHSDHHVKLKSFVQAEKKISSKKMPFGYSTMYWFALIPPLFFKIMNKELEKDN